MATHPSTTEKRRLRGDGGNAIVEFVLTMPLLIVLLFGIIDFGFTFNDWIAVRQGAREGLRQVLADTTKPGGKGDWSCNPVWLTKPDVADAKNVVCFIKDRVGLDGDDTRVKVFAPDGFVAGKPVKVCVQYKALSFSGLFSTFLDDRVLVAEAESLIEKTEIEMASVEEKPLVADTRWSPSCEEV